MAVFPYVNPIFQPSIRQISAISSSSIQNQILLLITTTVNHLYNNGLTVRLNIPLGYGCTQLDGLFSEIIVNSPTTFTMAFMQPLVFDPFVIPAPALQVPVVVPIAEDVLLLNSAEVNTLFTNFF